MGSTKWGNLCWRHVILSGFYELQDYSVNWDPLVSVLLLPVFEQRSEGRIRPEAASPYLLCLHLLRLQNGNIPLSSCLAIQGSRCEAMTCVTATLHLCYSALEAFLPFLLLGLRDTVRNQQHILKISRKNSADAKTVTPPVPCAVCWPTRPVSHMSRCVFTCSLCIKGGFWTHDYS